MPPIKKLISITVYPGTCQTTYVEGSYFNPSGVIVMANYSNGTSTQVYNYNYFVVSPLQTTTTSVQFTYSENGILKDDYLPITVTANKYPTSLVITTDSDFQSEQYYGDPIALDGLTIRVNYSDSTYAYLLLSNCSISYPSIDSTVVYGNNQVTFSYTENGHQVSTSISFTGKYLPKNNAYNSSIGNNPKWILSNLGMLFSYELIKSNQDGYPLTTSLFYNPNTYKKIKEYNHEFTDGNYKLSIRQFIVLDGSDYKYINEAGEIVTYSLVSGYTYYSTSGDYSILTIHPNGGNSSIIIEKSDGIKYHFDGDGYLTKIQKQSLSLIIEYNSNPKTIKKVYYDHLPSLFLSFSYGVEGLQSITRYSSSTIIDKTNLIYNNGQLININKCNITSPDTAFKTILTLSYNNDGVLSRVYSPQNKAFTKFTIYHSKLHSLGPIRFLLQKVEEGQYLNDVDVVEQSLEVSNTTFDNTQRMKIVRCILMNQDNLSIVHQVSLENGLVTTFESDGGNLKSLSKRTGLPLTLSNVQPITSTINGNPSYSLSGEETLLLVFATFSFISSNINSTSFNISFYLRMLSKPSRAFAILRLSAGLINMTFKEEIDSNNYNANQLISVPFTTTSSVLTYNISIIDETGNYISSVISDIRLSLSPIVSNKIDDTKLQDISSISLGNSSINNRVTISDLFNSIRQYKFNNQQILFFDNGKGCLSYSSSYNVIFNDGNSQIATLYQLISNTSLIKSIIVNKRVYEDSDTGISIPVTQNEEKTFSFKMVNNETHLVLQNNVTKNGETIKNEDEYDLYGNLLINKERLPYFIDEGAYLTTNYTYDTYGNLLSVSKVNFNSVIMPLLTRTYNSDGTVASENNNGVVSNYTYNSNKDLSRCSDVIDQNTNSFFNLLYDGYHRLTQTLFQHESNETGLTQTITYNSSDLVTTMLNGNTGYSFSYSSDYKTTNLSFISAGLGSGIIYSLRKERLTKTESFLEENVLSNGAYDTLTSTYNTSNLLISIEQYLSDFFIYTYQYSYNSTTQYAGLANISEISYNNIPEQDYSYNSLENISKIEFNPPDDFEIEHKPNGLKKYIFYIGSSSIDYVTRYPNLGEEQPYFDSINNYFNSDKIEQLSSVFICDSFGRISVIETQIAITSTAYAYIDYSFGYLTGSSTSPFLTSFTYNGYRTSGNSGLLRFTQSISYNSLQFIETIDTVTHINNVQSSENLAFTYDNFKRLSTYQKNSITETYSYSLDGLLTSVTNSSLGTWTYSYYSNRFGQISGVSLTNNNQVVKSHAYSYDSLGNRSSYNYYEETTLKEITTYNYLSGKLKKVTISDNLNQIETITLDYNSNGQLSKKVVSINNNNTTYQYFYDNGKLISMTAPQGRYYFYYDSIGVTGFILRSGINVYDIYICVRDSFNNIAYITDSSGNPLIKYDYDPWGNFTYQLLSFNPNILNVVSNFPFKYRGYIYDEDLKLYYLKSRFYDSVSRSFISRDHYSYLDITSPTGINLYCYCGYNPIMYTDENGNSALVVSLIVGTILGATWGVVSAATSGNNDKIGIGILIGAATGALTGIVGGLNGFLLFGSTFLIGAAGDILSQKYIEGRSWSEINLFRSVIAGCINGGLAFLSKGIGGLLIESGMVTFSAEYFLATLMLNSPLFALGISGSLIANYFINDSDNDEEKKNKQFLYGALQW